MANGENQVLSCRLRTEAEMATELRETVQHQEKEIQTLKVKMKRVQSQYESWVGKVWFANGQAEGCPNGELSATVRVGCH